MDWGAAVELAGAEAGAVSVTGQTVVPMVVSDVTTTSTAPISTLSVIQLTTLTATITNPPSTVMSGTKTVSTTLPTKTKTITKIGYTTITTTKTMAVTWTYTTTVIPSASASACKSKGGHYGIL